MLSAFSTGVSNHTRLKEVFDRRYLQLIQEVINRFQTCNLIILTVVGMSKTTRIATNPNDPHLQCPAEYKTSPAAFVEQKYP